MTCDEKTILEQEVLDLRAELAKLLKRLDIEKVKYNAQKERLEGKIHYLNKENDRLRQSLEWLKESQRSQEEA